MGAPAAATAAERPAPADAFTDLEITRAIERSLMSQAMLLFHDLEVSTADGVVTLVGEVDSLLDAERAVAVARATRGVRSIVDRIRVQPMQRSDRDLARDVHAALARDPALEAAEIEVDVTDGEATLSGRVDSWQEGRFALQVAKGVPGLVAVRSSFEIDYGEARPDAEIREDVWRRLASDVRVDPGLIDVDVRAGTVTLRGFVGSAAEREQAYWDAWVTGVKLVDASPLEVRWWARDRMRRREPQRPSDAEIARAVRAALRYDPRVAEPDVGVAVEKGTVVLSGSVSRLAARVAAEDDARNTLGAIRVENHLRVRSEAPPDDRELERRVELALAADAYEHRHEFQVSAHRGRVVLEGSVDSRFDLRRAEAVAGGVEGVREVQSRLERGGQRRALADPELQARIRDGLFWDARVDEAHIQIQVEEGVATLSGWVDDWRERERAETSALEEGASHVNNQLRVEPARD